ncbi:MAG: TetR/AcrR family transcriptional regulator [Deltaproteobacteria bacterium]|nr:TetR/AcrR family transcriptional regulator [Deltaproteobacteria bacterium]
MARSDETKRKLLQAAKEILIEQGHAAATVMAIARRAGVNHGLIIHYFGSKEGLFVALEKQTNEAFRQVMVDLLQAGEGLAFMKGFMLDTNAITLRQELEYMGCTMPALQKATQTTLQAFRKTMVEQLGFPSVPHASLIMATTSGLALQSTLDPELPREKAVELLDEWVMSQWPKPTP